MNNTGNISIKMGKTQNSAAWQGIVAQWLHHALRGSQARALIGRLLEQHELPVIQLRSRRASHRTHTDASA